MTGAMTIAGLELRRLVTDRSAFFFSMVLPVVVIIVIGSTFSATPVSLSIGVVVEAGGEPAVEAALDDASNIATRTYDSRRDLDVAIRTGAVSGGVVVGETGRTIVLDPADNNAGLVRSTLRGVLGRTATIEAVADAFDLSFAEASVVADVVLSVTVDRVIVDEGLGDADSAFAYTAPSNLVLFTFVNSLGVSVALVWARRTGITQRWASAPVATRSVVVGVLASRLGFAMLQSILIVLIGAGVFGVAWGDPIGVALLLTLFAIVATGAGVLVGVMAPNEDLPNALAVPIAIGFGMLGGCMWPLDIVADSMRVVGHITPHAWAMDGFVELIFRGGGVGDILTELAVLAGFAAVLIALSTRAMRRRLI